MTDLNPSVYAPLEHPNSRLRRAALDFYQIEDEASLKTVIPMLGDDVTDIVRFARGKIKTADYQSSLRLVKSLSLPRKKVREAVLDLLADMAIKDLYVFRFVQHQARICYQLMVQVRGIRRFSDSDLQRLLSVHLDERVWFVLQTTLQVLGAQGPSGPMRRIARGILSGDKRQGANGIEAMDNILDKSLKRLIMPLLEEIDADARVAAGKRLFPADGKELSTTPTVTQLAMRC